MNLFGFRVAAPAPVEQRGVAPTARAATTPAGMDVPPSIHPGPHAYGTANPYRVLQRDPFAGDRHEGSHDLDEFPPTGDEQQLAAFVIDTGLGFMDLVDESISLKRAAAVIHKVERWRAAEELLSRFR